MTVKVGDYVKIKPGVVAMIGYTVGKPYEVLQVETLNVGSANVRINADSSNKRQWFGPDEYYRVPVTPKVGDTIRATRGETVISGTVEYVASGSYAAAADNFNVRLDGKPESFFWVQKDDDFTVEIIKPKVVLPTGRFASIMVDAVLYTHFSNNWVTSSGSRYTDADVLRWINDYGYSFRVVFPGE